MMLDNQGSSLNAVCREAKRRKSGKNDKEQEQEGQDVTKAVHPLSVVVRMNAGGEKEKATLVFRYLTKLNIVTVESQWVLQKHSTHALLVTFH